jgi:hypothetical protein
VSSRARYNRDLVILWKWVTRHRLVSSMNTSLRSLFVPRVAFAARTEESQHTVSPWSSGWQKRTPSAILQASESQSAGGLPHAQRLAVLAREHSPHLAPSLLARASHPRPSRRELVLVSGKTLSAWAREGDALPPSRPHRSKPFTSLINTEKRSLDILLSLPYTYIVNLRCKYREDEDHGEIW